MQETSTQTDPQTRIVISKKNTNQQNSYCVKEEEQHIMTDIHQPTAIFVEEHPISENSIDINDQKLFECNIRFEVPKETERMTEDLANTIHANAINVVAMNVNAMNTNPINTNVINSNVINTNVINSNTIHSNLVPENTLQIPCPEEMSVVNVGLSDEEKIDNGDKTEINNKAEGYLDQQLLNETLEDQNSTPPKRTSHRKVKSLQNKTTFSDDEIDDNYYDQSSDSQDSEEPKFKCKVCLKRYSTQKGLKKHSLVHDKKHNCNVCLKTFCKLENLEKHKVIHVAKPHACQLCHTSFSKPQSLVKHLKSHSEKVNNIIKQINHDDQDVNEPKKELKSEEETEDEMLTSNEPDEFGNAPELFKCEICGQYCSTMKNLKRHALIHGEKKYSCFVCKKWFFRPDTLKKHAEKHGHGLLDNLMEDNKLYDSDDEPFTNSTGNIFGEHDNLKKDDSDEDATGEYKCQHCEKVMATKKGLRRHVSMHKPKAEPVTCEICKKVLRFYSNYSFK